MALDQTETTFSLRRTDLADCAALATLATPLTEAVFGSYNLVSVVEKAILSITAVDEKANPIGIIALYDAPDIAGVPQSRYACMHSLWVRMPTSEWFLLSNDI